MIYLECLTANIVVQMIRDRAILTQPSSLLANPSAPLHFSKLECLVSAFFLLHKHISIFEGIKWYSVHGLQGLFFGRR